MNELVANRMIPLALLEQARFPASIVHHAINELRGLFAPATDLATKITVPPGSTSIRIQMSLM